MILIISDKTDRSCIEVADHLEQANKVFFLIRIGVDEIRLINSTPSNWKICVNGDSVLESEEVTSVFFRRDRLQITKAYDGDVTGEVAKFMSRESAALDDFINYLIMARCVCVGNPFALKVNKLIVLDVADRCGLNVPTWLVATTKIDVLAFLKLNHSIITKPINTQMFFHEDEGSIGTMYTRDVSRDEVEMLAESFEPSFFQQKVHKKYDIRTVLLDNTFYSMAIMSQSNDQTSTDFRKYDYDNPNRRVKFRLPHIVEEQLRALHEQLRINCASIDLVVDQDDTYFFLETNPIGQFAMVSHSCQYNIEKAIANVL